MSKNNQCNLCETYSLHSVQFYDKYICEDCIDDIKAFEIDFTKLK
ncbi:MAG: hypothetical protein RR495_01890 [Anaerovoracaceae bacterium]